MSSALRRATAPVTTQVQGDRRAVSGCAPEIVELGRVELPAFSMRTRRATNCAIAPCAAVTYLLRHPSILHRLTRCTGAIGDSITEGYTDSDSHGARGAAALLHVDTRGIEPLTFAV